MYRCCSVCAQLFRFKTCFLWCKIQLSIYFPIDGFPLRLDFFPSSHDKQSAFLIRLGKHKTSSWLHLRKGNLHLIKYPPAEERELATDNLPPLSLLIAGVTFHFYVGHKADTFTTLHTNRNIKQKLLYKSKRTDKDDPLMMAARTVVLHHVLSLKCIYFLLWNQMSWRVRIASVSTALPSVDFF